jgi:hypothetical protein
MSIVDLHKCDDCGKLYTKIYHYVNFRWCYNCAKRKGMIA